VRIKIVSSDAPSMNSTERAEDTQVHRCTSKAWLGITHIPSYEPSSAKGRNLSSFEIPGAKRNGQGDGLTGLRSGQGNGWKFCLRWAIISGMMDSLSWNVSCFKYSIMRMLICSNFT